MHAVVNHLPIRPEADWADIAARFAKFAKFATDTGKAFPKLKAAVLMRAGDTEAIFMGCTRTARRPSNVSS